MVELNNIHIVHRQIVKYPKKHEIRRVLVHNLQYHLYGGSVLTIMGSSGSGKSTLLNFITGIIDTSVFDTSGEVRIDGERIDVKPIHERRIGLLSQEGLLFPHMTVAQNLLFALSQPLPKHERKGFVHNMLEKAQLEQYVAGMYPHTLSGGQQSRLALIRTMLSAPKFLLLDEPFAKLDTSLRKTMRDWVWKNIQDSGIPALLVSHDEEDIYDKNMVYYIDGE